ncbi:MAG: divergent polysaccharide deacetylase family protein [Alphaproteobacteria bacterium]
MRRASIVLLLAWLSLLAGLATTGGYVLMLPKEHDGTTQVAIAFGPGADADAQPEVAEVIDEPAHTQESVAPRPELAGAQPRWQRYSQDFDESDKRPRIAVVLTGMGLSSATTEAAINQLPAAVTLSFTPYSRRLGQWVSLARTKGHEVMLDLPMEPTSYPDDDPGPQALLTALSPAQNLDRLNWTLNRVDGYVGVATVMGSRFTTEEDALAPVLEALKEQGLIFLDNRSSQESVAWRLAAKMGVANALNDRTLDTAQASRVAIDARLVQLEGIARADGFAVAMGRPYPVTIERLREWAKGLPERGFVLAPISAVVDRQRHHLGITQSTQAK